MTIRAITAGSVGGQFTVFTMISELLIVFTDLAMQSSPRKAAEDSGRTSDYNNCPCGCWRRATLSDRDVRVAKRPLNRSIVSLQKDTVSSIIICLTGESAVECRS